MRSPAVKTQREKERTKQEHWRGNSPNHRTSCTWSTDTQQMEAKMQDLVDGLGYDSRSIATTWTQRPWMKFSQQQWNIYKIINLLVRFYAKHRALVGWTWTSTHFKTVCCVITKTSVWRQYTIPLICSIIMSMEVIRQQRQLLIPVYLTRMRQKLTFWFLIITERRVHSGPMNICPGHITCSLVERNMFFTSTEQSCSRRC